MSLMMPKYLRGLFEMAPRDPTMAIAAMVGGTILQAKGQADAGRAAAEAGLARQQASEYTARQREVQAGQERAIGQRRSAEEQRRKRIVQSNAVARAAASGAGAADPTVIDILGDLEEEGLYRAGVALYEGEERARAQESGAILDRYEGEQYRRAGEVQRRAGNTAAFGTILRGGASVAEKFPSLYEKYG